MYLLASALRGRAPVGAEAVILHAARVPLGPLGAGPRVALVRCNFSLPPQAPQTEKELERAADVDRGRAERVRDVVPVWKSTSENRHCHANEADTDRRRLSVFSASARRKRAAGHLRQVEKKHSHDPHPGVTGELEYDHPVSYAVAVAKKHAEEAAAPALQLRGGRA